jgi:hypothetical protein
MQIKAARFLGDAFAPRSPARMQLQGAATLLADVC